MIAVLPAPSADAVDTQLVTRLRMAVLRLARRLRQQVEGEITASQLAALASIDRQGPLTIGELAAVERVRRPTMTRIVACLEAAGLIARRADPRDRRFVHVEVSADGHRFLERTRSRRDAFLAERIQALPPAERTLLWKAVPVIERLLEEEAAGP